MNEDTAGNTEELDSSSAETEPHIRSMLKPTTIKLPHIRSILHEMEEKGIRLPSGLTKRIEDISVENEEERFSVITKIGQGGMSQVYRVFDRDIGRMIAVKVIKLEKNNPVNFKRALNEMQITGQLEHPNIMPLHDVGIDDNNNLYFSMKLIKGEDLGSILENLRKNKHYKGFNRQRLLEIFIKVCDAVAFAHSRDVIHRDLKPHNIMVGEFGEVLLTDWGLAKIVKQKKPSRKLLRIKSANKPDVSFESVDKSSSPYKKRNSLDTDDTDFGTRHGAVAGTPAFMPPEQALGDITNIDSRSDIYSLGGILYHILTYFPPFVGSLPEIIEKVVKGDIRKPTSINEEIPKELEIIALKAMSHHKANRHHTAKELKEEVQAFLDNKPIDRISYSVFDLSRKFWIRHKLIFIWAFIASAVTAFVVFVGVRNHYEEKYKVEKEFLKNLTKEKNIATDEFKTKHLEITELMSEIKNINTEISEINKTAESYKDLNNLGLPRTGYYWQLQFRRQFLMDEKFKAFRSLLPYLNFIIFNSSGDAKLSKARTMLYELEQEFKNTYTFKKWEILEKNETERLQKLALRQDPFATLNLDVKTAKNAPIIEADIRIFQLIEGDRFNLSLRRIPIPYTFNKEMKRAMLPPRLQYAPVPEILGFWLEENNVHNKIKQNSNVKLTQGDYIITISVNYLSQPIIVGLTVPELNNFKLKITIPAEKFENDDFSFVPGFQHVNARNEKSAKSFYVAKNEVTFSQYLKFLNSKENPSQLFENPSELLPRSDNFSTLVTYDSKIGKIVLFDKISKNQPVTGISYFDIVEYLRWLNARNETKGEYRLMTLQQYKRLNPFNWDYVWGYRDNKYFRLADETAHYFADTSIFSTQGLNTGTCEFVFDNENTRLFSTTAEKTGKFSQLIPVTQSTHFENTTFRLVYIEK